MSHARLRPALLLLGTLAACGPEEAPSTGETVRVTPAPPPSADPSPLPRFATFRAQVVATAPSRITLRPPPPAPGEVAGEVGGPRTIAVAEEARADLAAVRRGQVVEVACRPQDATIRDRPAAADRTGTRGAPHGEVGPAGAALSSGAAGSGMAGLEACALVVDLGPVAVPSP